MEKRDFSPAWLVAEGRADRLVWGAAEKPGWAPAWSRGHWPSRPLQGTAGGSDTFSCWHVIEFSLSKLSHPALTEAQLGTQATMPLVTVLFATNHVREYSEPMRTSDAGLLQNPLPLISQQIIPVSFCISGTDFSKSYSRSAPGLGLLLCERKNYSSPLLAEIIALSPCGP